MSISLKMDWTWRGVELVRIFFGTHEMCGPMFCNLKSKTRKTDTRCVQKGKRESL